MNAASRALVQQHLDSLRQLVEDAKRDGRCIDCGPLRTYPAHVLVFVHRDPQARRFDPDDWKREAPGLDVMRDEIGRCDVLCLNCQGERRFRSRARSVPLAAVTPRTGRRIAVG